MNDTAEILNEEATTEDDSNASILEAFNEGVESEQDEDSIKMLMIQEGATFKNVTRLYNQFMIDAGLAISKSDRNQIVDETLEGVDLSTEDAFDAATEALVANVKGATERSAAALVRSFAKKNEVECYKKPAGEGGTRNPFVQVFHEALIENPSMDEDGLKAIIAGLEEKHQVNPTRWFNQHNNIRKTANAIAAKYA